MHQSNYNQQVFNGLATSWRKHLLHRIPNILGFGYSINARLVYRDTQPLLLLTINPCKNQTQPNSNTDKTWLSNPCSEIPLYTAPSLTKRLVIRFKPNTFYSYREPHDFFSLLNSIIPCEDSLHRSIRNSDPHFDFLGARDQAKILSEYILLNSQTWLTRRYHSVLSTLESSILRDTHHSIHFECTPINCALTSTNPHGAQCLVVITF